MDARVSPWKVVESADGAFPWKEMVVSPQLAKDSIPRLVTPAGIVIQTS